MRWVRDLTGRFAQRPHFETGELDAECERLVTEFLKKRCGTVTFPISNDDLQVLVEEHASDLDLYADLSDRGDDVEGVTVFERDGRPRVLIAKHLSEQPWSHNRLRTTLTHELGHAHFHNLLYQVAEQPELFSSDVGTRPQPECHRDQMHTLSTVDWMEWQAGYACGAFLIPRSHALKVVRHMRDVNTSEAIPNETSVLGQGIITEVATTFDTSKDASRVRLIQLGYVLKG